MESQKSCSVNDRMGVPSRDSSLVDSVSPWSLFKGVACAPHFSTARIEDDSPNPEAGNPAKCEIKHLSYSGEVSKKLSVGSVDIVTQL